MKTILALCLAFSLSGSVFGAADPINTTCPIMGKPVSASSELIDVNGQTVAVCCKRCVSAFSRWDDDRKATYVASMSAADEPIDVTPKPAVEERIGDPYPLATCAFSGEKLGSMGSPVTVLHEGRELRFNTKAHAEAFRKDPAPVLKQVDEKIIETQTPFYPTSMCVVMPKESLLDQGEDIAIDYVHNNRLFRLCCKSCIRDLRADPDKYTEALDEAVVAAQVKDYPLTMCVVMSAELGSMGEPVEMVIGNQLIRLCCKGCDRKIYEDPAKYLARVDQARKAKSN